MTFTIHNKKCRYPSFHERHAFIFKGDYLGRKQSKWERSLQSHKTACYCVISQPYFLNSHAPFQRKEENQTNTFINNYFILFLEGMLILFLNIFSIIFFSARNGENMTDDDDDDEDSNEISADSPSVLSNAISGHAPNASATLPPSVPPPPHPQQQPKGKRRRNKKNNKNSNKNSNKKRGWQKEIGAYPVVSPGRKRLIAPFHLRYDFLLCAFPHNWQEWMKALASLVCAKFWGAKFPIKQSMAKRPLANACQAESVCNQRKWQSSLSDFGKQKGSQKPCLEF